MTPEDLTAARQYVRAYARWRCGGKLPLYKGCPPGQTGRGKLDPVYVEETQGRDMKAFWERYSSCGDLSQGVVEHLNITKPYRNRADGHGKGWVMGWNLLNFYASERDARDAGHHFLADYARDHGSPAIKPPADYVPQAGDIGFIWTPGQNNAHTFVFGNILAFGNGSSLADAAALVVETFNFGAGGMTRTEYPGAHCVESHVERRNGGLRLGQRKLQFVVPLERLLTDSDGLPPMSGDVIDEMEARVP